MANTDFPHQKAEKMVAMHVQTRKAYWATTGKIPQGQVEMGCSICFSVLFCSGTPQRFLKSE